VAYLVWAYLTDIASHPQIANRAFCEERSRIAAAKWLELDLARPEAIELRRKKPRPTGASALVKRGFRLWS
jgi:hypothetical protein